MKASLKTKIWCLVIFVALIFNVLPVTVFAEEIIDATDENTGIEGDVDGDGVEGEPGDEDGTGDAEEIIDYSKAVDVSTAEELELMLGAGERVIRITADFMLDRTFCVVSDVIIFADEVHTLTRAPGFGKDIFLVGECQDGTPTTGSVELSLGKPGDEESANITIDGNTDNMIADVVGSVIFVCNGSRADLYSSLTVKNCKKVGNERTLGEYGVSYPPRVGGAVAIVAKGAKMAIYGGSYVNNTVNDITDSSTDEGNLSSQGGVIYNYGVLDVYGGTFENNHAGRGGVFYNYRTMNLYNAVIKNNSASSLGGAIYVPNSTSAFTYIGEENDVVASKVLFEGNTSDTHAGAIYNPVYMTVKNTTFKNNVAVGSGGAIFGTSAEMLVEYSEFVGNSAGTNGGAVYVTSTNGEEDVRELEIINSTFKENTAVTRGGAVYASETARVYVAKSNFHSNSATYGGAVYLTGSELEINVAEMYDNGATSNGGAIALYSTSSALINGVTAGRNRTDSSGGFIYATNSTFELYNSSVVNNAAATHGGGVIAYTGAGASIYNTVFEGNEAGKNGGAVAVYPEDKLSTVIHSCTFTGNIGGELGGAVWVSAKGQLDIYNATARGNHGTKGGFLYITTSGTVVDLIGVTVSGNTDTAGGPIIWGNTTNAKLNIDKLKYVDEDYEGDWDDAYWSAAIYNLLTVTEVTGEIPSYVDYGTGEVITPAPPAASTDVETAAQLERALQVGYAMIRITADFEIDRTFYITANTTIYSTSKHTITRAPGFGGDMFVVGQYEDGQRKEGVTLTLGKADSAESGLLVIDGNSENMTVDVVGTVVFVCTGASAALYPNLTLTNNKKVGNDRLVNGDYAVSYPARVGGAAIIIESRAVVDIYGGNYTYNVCNNITDANTDEGSLSSHGGAIYNYGTLNVYGGVFRGNHSGRGGAFYNYRTLNLYNAVISGNSASTYGGAIYVPNSTGAFTYIGEENEIVESSVTFSGNTAVSGGGAIYARNLLSVNNTTFDANSVTSGSGGAIHTTSPRATVSNSVFKNNTASNNGAAIYLTANNEREETLELVVRDTDFVGNSATASGGAVYMSNLARAYMYDTDFMDNSAKSGGAIYVTNANIEINVSEISGNSATGAGGAIYVYNGAYALLNSVTAVENSSGSSGGFTYATKSNAQVDVYNSYIAHNTAVTHGGAITAYTAATTKVYNTHFEGNEAVKNGGAIAIYPEDKLSSVIHSCTFVSNTADAYGGAIWISAQGQVGIYNVTAKNNHGNYGGFLYLTTSGSIVDLVGVTVSGNTDNMGGPIIWGNTYNAKLFIDKGEYSDLDNTGALNDAYWAAAIYNKLTVEEFDGSVPKYLDYGNESYDNMPDAVDVATADELEAAILSGKKHIRIVADFEIDRTFYITGDTTVFTTITHTLTRAPGFGGDIFVIGEDKNGSSSLLKGNNATLTLGNPDSKKSGLLVIDGNSENMTVDVVGSALFICEGAIVNLYENVTVTNCTKVGNDRTLLDRHMLSIENRIGGTVAVVANGTLNIYGGTYSYNKVNKENTELGEDGRNSTVGGAIFNNSNLNIYGGTFEYNEAARGGVIYSYRVTHIYGGSFVGNRATAAGGVYYAPNSAQAHLYIGAYDGTGAEVLFEGNSSLGSGGVIYSSTLAACVIYGKASFVNNVSESSGGAICSYGQLAVRDSEFIGNAAKNRGGAVFASNSSIENTTRISEFTNCRFESNLATLGGALSFYASGADYPEGAIVRITDCEFVSNVASTEIAGASSASGGAIYADRKSDVKIVSSTFDGNSASTEAGAIYAAGESSVELVSSSLVKNTSGKHGGAIVVRSSYLELSDVELSDNTAAANGGAIYVSYQSNRPINSKVSIIGSVIKNNVSGGNGGAIYVTRRDIADDWCILTVNDTDFIGNVAAENGGAVCIVAGSESYFSGVGFTSNSVGEEGEHGGAMYVSGSKSTVNGGTFTGNSAPASGGAIYLLSAEMTLNDVTARENSTGSSGGFVCAEESLITVYDSEIISNSSVTHGGAVYVYTGSSASIYNTHFESNTAEKNGGAVAVYPGDTVNTVLHSCTFTDNTAAEFGGAVWVSAKGQLGVYNVTAKNNNAGYGGFMYATTAGSIVTVVGLTVSGNTDSKGGPIIWGNTYNAKLLIDKSKYTDLDATGALDDAYWAYAIYNKITVEEINGSVPTYDAYKEPEVEPEETVTKTPVSVDEIFSLGESSSDGYINSTYDKFPVLDNSSNFMSDGTTYFEGINGETVSVDSFIYQAYAPDGNCSVGEGLLIYQAMLYKKAHPEEEVSIAISSYRFSIEAALNINRNSRYFGYMRNLVGQEYDSYGFVRISYLLVSAAKMGIHVNVIGQIDGYPIAASDPNFHEYFTAHLTTPCDPDYATGVVGDYLEFNESLWPLYNKGGTDMMHTKLCAVSHYLDMNGVAHRNAVWTSSSNLDGITSKGYNGNWKLQTATIVSDHEYIYRTSVNYLNLIAKYSGTIDGIYEFQDVVNQRTTEQIQLILAGRADEIADGEQIVYLGTENDDVFELYFTPFGGGSVVWDEVNNPYCKYLRELYNSEDYILFSWNAAEYNSSFPFGKQIEAIINGSFTENKSPNNAFYGRMEAFDRSTLAVLVKGVDIGYFSLNELQFNQVHNKDILMSYVKGGQRYYVSLLNSCNMHSGSMSFQSNFALVIKEKELTEDSVFFTMADNSTKGIVEHTYGEEQIYLPEDGSHGYYYHACQYCDKVIIGELIHRPSGWIIDKEASVGVNGVQHKECTVCGSVLETKEVIVGEKSPVREYGDLSGARFPNESCVIDVAESGAVRTIEALIQLSRECTGRGGVVVGNYNYGVDNLINLEIYYDGCVRLYYKSGGVAYSCVFAQDIRSNELVHIAVTVDDGKASLYINGELSQVISIKGAIPESISNIRVGGDNRTSDKQIFAGKIYSVALFSDVRSALEVSKDAAAVSANADGLLYSRVYASELPEYDKSMLEGIKVNENTSISTGTGTVTAHTLEAIILLDKTFNGAGGVVMGSYNGDSGLNFEILENGNPGLYYEVEGVKYSHVFNTDIRSSDPVHLAITIDGLTASLYVNGRFIEALMLDAPIPELDGAYAIGNDNCLDNDNCFKGTVIGAALFADVRSSVDIAHDSVLLPDSGDSLIYSAYFRNKASDSIVGGTTFDAEALVDIGKLSDAPKTFEAIIRVPTSLSDRAGVIVGNYNGRRMVDQINIEIYNGGRPRIYYNNTGESVTWVFNTDVRSDKPIHIAITVEGEVAKLYVNGNLMEIVSTGLEFPEPTEGFKVGGDRRPGNTQYFKGGIYAVHMFSDVRSAEQIKADCLSLPDNADSLVYSGSFYTSDDLDIAGVAESIKPVGQKYDGVTLDAISGVIASLGTIEATIMVPTDCDGRAGVIVGNYVGNSIDQINLEVYEEGKIRLFYVNEGNRVSVKFNTDVRSDKPVHVALTVDGSVITLYLNGVATESAKVSIELPENTSGYIIGGDHRPRNTQYFKGSIYSLAIFGDVRSADEIFADVRLLPTNADNLIYSTVFTRVACSPTSESDEHIVSDWIVYREQGEDAYRTMYKKCLACGMLLATKADADSADQEIHVDYTNGGFKPESEMDATSVGVLASSPKTFEALIQLDREYSSRAGVILGSYNGSNADGINLEIYSNGAPRLYYKVGRVGYSVMFNADVRSDALTHIAVTVDGLEAKLYINGEYVETATLEKLPPEITEGFKIGNDNRPTSGQYFKGTIYAVHFFDDVRSAEEIASDAIMVTSDAEGLIYSQYYTGE